MPTWLVDIGKVFPLEHAARGLQSAFLLKGSTGIDELDVGVLIAWAVFGLVFASRNFRWEARGAGRT
jgi:ABC-type multidrug transport system permease subunit